MELWVEFLGWYLTEGSSFETPSNYTISISQYEKAHPEFRNRIIQIIKEMGYHPYITDKDIKIHSKQSYLLISTLVPKGARNKFIPSRFKNLSSRYLNILFNTMMDGDGCNNTYKTSSKKLLSLSFIIPYEGEIYYLEVDLSLDNTEVYKLGYDKAIIKLDCALKNIEPENVLHKLKLCLVFS
jgi:putative lipoic acid-binding regulatory protein